MSGTISALISPGPGSTRQCEIGAPQARLAFKRAPPVAACSPTLRPRRPPRPMPPPGSAGAPKSQTGSSGVRSSNSRRKSPQPALFHLLLDATHAMNGVQRNRMTNYPYILFNKSPEQLRLLGARGGRAYGRNQRDRRAQMPTPPPASVPQRAAPRETAAQASSRLDSQFPWLRGAERRLEPVSPAGTRCTTSGNR